MTNSTIKQAQQLAQQSKQLVRQMRQQQFKSSFESACIKRFGRLLKKGDVLEITDTFPDDVRLIRVDTIKCKEGGVEVACVQMGRDGKWIRPHYQHTKKWGWNEYMWICKSDFSVYKVKLLDIANPKHIDRYVRAHYQFVVVHTTDKWGSNESETSTTYDTFEQAKKAADELFKQVCVHKQTVMSYNNSSGDSRNDQTGEYVSVRIVMVAR